MHVCEGTQLHPTTFSQQFKSNAGQRRDESGLEGIAWLSFEVIVKPSSAVNCTSIA